MPARTADTLAERLRPLTGAPDAAAVFCDVDGTLAPIVERAEDANLPHETSRLLHSLGRRYACVACISGRSALDAKRIVGVGSIAYAGIHGAELIQPGAREPTPTRALAGWEQRVRKFAAGRDTPDLRRLRVRIEHKGPIVAFHWRGAGDEDAAREHVDAIAGAAEGDGLKTHWGRKVLEVRPPVPIDKGQVIRRLTLHARVRTALFGGDDATDLDGFDALDALESAGELDAALRIGVRSDEGPPAIVERADVVVEGPAGFLEVLRALAEA